MTFKYFGVIGNRDHIKIGKGSVSEERRPFWEFLDEQPDGWLTSLVYGRKDFPKNRRGIVDCGAWSYRDTQPKHDAASIVEKYLEIDPRKGSFLVAPDHMLIGQSDDAERYAWNMRQAKIFLKECPQEFVPMACIHGNSLDERMKCADELMSVGYKHLSVGGVAARASQKKQVLAVVSALRELTRGNWLHILGLSSPEYVWNWRRLGVDSCDGSSHFKQAFTGGAFFTVEGARLIKHKAARTCRETFAVIEEITAPLCDCTACRRLRYEDIDTRTYGSNEHNMGRAAHNLNMLMRAHRYVAENPDCFAVQEDWL